MLKSSNMIYKTLVVGVIVLFCGISVQPCIAISDNDTDDVNNDSGESSEDGTPDDYNEIISTVRGEGWRASWGWQKYPLVVIDLYLREGKYYINCFTRNPSKLFYHDTAKSIQMGRFIGLFFQSPDDSNIIIGIAIGDITWEPYDIGV